MPQNFLSCDRDQVMLLPPSISEWLPVDHLARFVIATVEELDLTAVYGYYRQDGHGRAAHDPAMMVALVLYAYAIGVTSSRAIERRCGDDVAFRVITANRQPDHATIARFLIRHRDALSELFFQVLGLCRRAGMVRVGTVAVDSTKLAANASAAQNRTLEGLRAEAERIIQEAIDTDEREDALYGEKRGDELPEELVDPRTRAGRIRELLEQARLEGERLEAERVAQHERQAAREATPRGQRKAGAPPGKQPSREQQKLLAKKVNLTDPDSGIVRHRGMLMQGYNVQTAVGEGQVILAIQASSQSPDGGQLAAMVQQAQGNLKRAGITDPLDEVLADSGYWSIAQVSQLQQAGLRVLVPPIIRARDPYRASALAVQMRAALGTEEGKSSYQRRQQIIEPVFAHCKHIRGITRLWRRGKHAVQAELELIATTHNLLKLRTALQAA